MPEEPALLGLIVQAVKQVLMAGPELPVVGVLLGRLLAGFLLGCMVAAVYHFTTRGPGRPANIVFLTTITLLSVLIAMVALVVGGNTALAFSLVGTLSIVRFRTVVEDTRDTAFVIFAVVVGMAAGNGTVVVALAGTPFVVLGALLFRPRVATPAEERFVVLSVRLGTGRPPDDRLREMLDLHLPGHRLIGLSTARGGAALDLTYTARLPTPETALLLVSELSRLEGVQGVELKER